MADHSPHETLLLDAAAVRSTAEALLMASGLDAESAAVVARCLVQADLRGVDTHGILRLPGYLARLNSGLANRSPALAVTRFSSVAALVDGDDGLGFVVANRCMDLALAMAREHGIGLVSARRSAHFGMAASYVLKAVEAGYIGLVLTNASRAMPAWGSREALLGTSPLAVGVPAGSEVPFILDMSPAAAARGKIRNALRRNESIPLGYALDPDGRPTTDAARALAGVVLPIGGPKGSGLAMMMDILCGVLSGAGFAGDVGDQYKAWDRPQNVGHMFLAMKPDMFMPLETFRARMDHLVRTVHAAPLAEGHSEVLMPGEIEGRLERERLRSGIPYRASDLRELHEVLDAAGLPRPAAR